MSGFVSFVSAGPGDPEWMPRNSDRTEPEALTVRAALIFTKLWYIVCSAKA